MILLLGGLGKSRWAKWLFVTHGAMLMGPDPRSNAALYKGCETVALLDAARSAPGLDFESIEGLKNGLLINTKYQCVVKQGPPTCGD